MKDCFYLETIHGRVFCRQWGRGETLLIAIHGFGEHSKLFDGLDSSFSENKWMMAFDLPFHGKTEWNKQECGREDIKHIIEMLLERAQKTTCTLLGFSLGGRIALSLWPDMQGKVETMTLLAPDGIRTKGLAWPETIPFLFRKLIRRWILSSKRSGRLFQWFSRQLWLPDTSRKFAHRQLSNPERLRTSLNWWVSLDAFPVSAAMIRKMASLDPIPVQIWVGTRDPLIRLQDIQSFWQSYPALDVQEVKGKGHRVGFTD